MEARKNTTAGVLFWTPAPVQTSPTSSVISEDEWEDGDEEQAEKDDDDFFSQMDENGIIGLAEALEDVELGGSGCESDAECNPQLYPRPINPEDTGHNEDEGDAPEELSYNQSEHLSHCQSPGEDVQLSPFEYLPVQAQGQQTDLDKTDEEKDGEEAAKRNDRKKRKNKHSSSSRVLGTTIDSDQSYISKGESEKISATQSHNTYLLAMDPTRSASNHCPVSPHASPATAHTSLHLLHFTAEEMATAPGIDAETFPEISFTESPTESPRSHISLTPSPQCTEAKLIASLQPAVMFSQEVMSDHHRGLSNEPLKASDKSDKRHEQPTPSPRKLRQLTPEGAYSRTRSLSIAKADSMKFKHHRASPDRELRSNAAGEGESRKGPLCYGTPDFSKVSPRVCFPKGGYKPPKSRHSTKRESLSTEPPLVFKSPADIVKEVLLNTRDGSPASSDSNRSQSSALNSTVPQEFRCRQQATTLLEQLQEDYNRLLTKYAEAENTIDRLRLEAKVNLYSDPPKPGHLVHAGLNRNPSKLMMLNFPQCQRAEMNSASPLPNGHNTHQGSPSAHPSTRSPEPQLGCQLAKILYSQADKFFQQLQTSEDLLKNKKLLPFEHMKGLSQLAEGLDSLERGYLLARDEHKLLQQQGATFSHFDPERELEGLIFQCGLRMEELKEQVEQMQQEQPTCEAPPSPPPLPTPSSVSSEGTETLTHPQSPPGPLLVDPGEAAAVEVSSASEESDEEEETLNSLYVKPVNGKHKHIEEDFVTLMDHYQSFKELPNLLDLSQREGAPLSATLRNMKSIDEKKDRPGYRTRDLQVQRKAKSDYRDCPPACTSKQQTSRSSPSSRRASSQSSTPPVHPPSGRTRLEMGKTHSSSLSSLGEFTALERRSSKIQTGSSRVLSQDGIISPETDSGFVCSESSRLTPAAAPSPLHQKASESVSVPQEGNPGKPQIEPIPTSSAPTSSHCHSAKEHRRGQRFSHDQLRRTRQGQRRRTLSCSPQRCSHQSEQSRVRSGTSEPVLESDSSVSEDRPNNQYVRSINSLHNSSPSSSPTARHCHGDSLRALSSSQAANRNAAIQALQAEVTRLRESLESCLRDKKLLSSVRAPPSAQNYTHHNSSNSSTPHIRSGERWGDISREGRDRLTDDEVEDFAQRQTTRKRPTSAHQQTPQPDILMMSEPSTPQPHPQVSRYTQTSTSTPNSSRSHPNTIGSQTHPGWHPGVFEAADEPDSRGRQAPLCPQCLSLHHRGGFQISGNREPTHSSPCHHCPVCGHPEPYRSSEPDPSCRPADSMDRTERSRYCTAAAPALLQCMPVCPPPPLLLCSSPFYMSPSNGTSSGVRGHGEVRRRTRHFLSSEEQRSIDSSLNRAIRAARHMKHTSGHMARSLASGLLFQEQLTQSCS